MKNSKLLVDKKKKPGLTVIKQVMVQSRTTPGDYHTVRVYEDGSMDCDCVGNGIFKEECWHIKRVGEMIEEKEIQT